MRLNDIMHKHPTLFLIVSIIILIVYGLLQINIVNVVQFISLSEQDSFIVSIIVLFAKIICFFSGFLTIAFTTLITDMYYNFFSNAVIEKKSIFLAASFGFIFYFIFYIGIAILLNKLNLNYEAGYIVAENIQQSKEYANIQLLTRVFRFVYYVYMVIVMSIIANDTWPATVKYTFLLTVVYIIQTFVLTKGV